MHYDYQAILQEIDHEIGPSKVQGKVASYIPELANVAPNKYGVSIKCVDGRAFALGDAYECFSIQSISKVLLLTMGMTLVGDSIWERVGVEPSGDPFNSLAQLEYENGIPRNPLINAGALVVADILVSNLDHPKKDFLQFVRKIVGNDDIEYTESVARSEQTHGFRNAAMVNLLKSFDNIKNDTHDVLDFYFHQCSLAMSCDFLASSFAYLANGGSTLDGQKILSRSQSKRVNAIMQTCGFYDEAGEFSFKVGLPGKSGVGGGIVAVFPGMYSVAVWSPGLNEKGNSALGMRTLELLTTKTGYSIF